MSNLTKNIMLKGRLVLKKNLLLSILSLAGILFTSCNHELTNAEVPLAEQIDPATKPCEELLLKDFSRFTVGVSYANKQNHEGTQHIIREASQITSTQFFPSLIWRGENNFDFSATDRAVEYAVQNGKAVHTHCLVYAMRDVNPGWLRDFRGSNAQFEELMKKFIQTTVSRYKGKVKGWDLANELFHYNSGNVDKTWLRNRFNSDQEYLDFIGRCFRYAHAADPNALLFYNDYGQEFSNNNFEKGRAIAAQIAKWKKEGVPIHGYGLQVHTNVFRPIEHIENALRLAASTGLLVHISELDIAINYVDWDIPGMSGGVRGVSSVNNDLLQRQKEMYKKVADTYYRAVPKNQQYGITLWDLNDKYSWLNWSRFEAGTLFDVNNNRKPAFYGFFEGATGRQVNCN
jgi:endo-1,4-beta-xylanase